MSNNFSPRLAAFVQAKAPAEIQWDEIKIAANAAVAGLMLVTDQQDPLLKRSPEFAGARRAALVLPGEPRMVQPAQNIWEQLTNSRRAPVQTATRKADLTFLPNSGLKVVWYPTVEGRTLTFQPNLTGWEFSSDLGEIRARLFEAAGIAPVVFELPEPVVELPRIPGRSSSTTGGTACRRSLCRPSRARLKGSSAPSSSASRRS